MSRIGIVGAGAAAAAATFVLDTTRPNAEITVLEKSGGLCGRAATRRHGELTYDYGANYVKSDDERVVELLTETLDDEGLVDADGPIYTFDESGTVSPGRDADEHKWSYRSGLTQIAKRLFGRTDAAIHRRTKVETVRRDDGTWTLLDTDGGSWGPFDVLVLNPPAPQTAALLGAAEWDSPRREKLRAAVAEVPYRSVWTAVLHYPFGIDRPYYGLVNTDKEHAVGWISREECKAGHVPDGETLLVVQAGGEWSEEHYDDDPADNVATLAEHAAAIVGDDRLAEPTWTDHQGWRYALPEGSVRKGPLDSAESAGLYCLGDWIPGEGRLHAALANGLDVGERLAYSL
ncbi:NAD(P)-binding protein [Natronomonas sp. F2-12]|jgi:predicted NAD/FAD-dependent oxidoreductase|uniref:NAD(P)-binding protein n=1 Tax=Natronomonas aquatica TaxID=2841590 RepID=A0A9R1CS31_9EURY|nr:NAD(P)-binding protein [Natronomonas aquatica]MCQ4332664.1 NAD(P)-binding protein [Natronomonas aquatica]